MSWSEGLSGTPLEIARTPDTPLRVMAGPGTGKTFALMRRVARLLEQGEDPQRILVCTFTRNAANDLQQELAALDVPGAQRVKAGTLHAYCFGMLAREDVLTLTGRVPRPLLQFEQRFLEEDLKGGNFGGLRDVRERLEAFNAAWARLQSEDPGWPRNPVDQRFHAELLDWLKFHQAMLVGEIVPEALRYLRDNPASPDRNAFDHVLVDEYQDLNRAEQETLDLLAGEGAMTVVGDEDQSIYSFKYAHPEGVATFDRTHPGTHDEGLEQCRRCPKLIVRMANHLIRKNRGRTPRRLQAQDSNPQGEVYVVQWQNMAAEANGIAQFVEQRIATGSVSAGKILVLSPRRQFGYEIRDALTNLGTPAHSFFHEEALEGNPKHVHESEAQQSFSLLTLLSNPNDRVALRCLCGFGVSTLASSPWARLRTHCADTDETPYEALERIASGHASLPYTSRLVTQFSELKRRVDELQDLMGQDLTDELFPDNASWAEPFRELAGGIEEADYEPQELRDVIRVGVTQPELPTDVDYVRIMSLHKAKGLTADLVIVVGCLQGLMPFVKTGLSRSQQLSALQEQRRLFYVAVTRTRQTLVLSSVASLPRDLAYQMGARVHRGNATHARTIASQFLGELGPARPEAVRGDAFLHDS